MLLRLSQCFILLARVFVCLPRLRNGTQQIFGNTIGAKLREVGCDGGANFFKVLLTLICERCLNLFNLNAERSFNLASFFTEDTAQPTFDSFNHRVAPSMGLCSLCGPLLLLRVRVASYPARLLPVAQSLVVA